MARVHIIGIAGGSCSGKTRLLRQLTERLGESRCAVVLQDNYYHSRPEAQKDNLKFNFDHPDAIDFDLLADDLEALKGGRSVTSPHYDFARHERIAGRGVPVSPRPLILVDGILILTDPRMRRVLDLSVYIHCDSDERLRRRIARDVAERGRTEDNVIAQFTRQVEPMHQAHVRPSASHADMAFSQSAVDDHSALDRLYDYCRAWIAERPSR